MNNGVKRYASEDYVDKKLTWNDLKDKPTIPSKLSDLEIDMEVGGGASLFVVNITGNEDDGYTADKTFAEIREAIDEGKVVQAAWQYEGCDVVCSFAYYDHEEEYFIFKNAGYDYIYEIFISSDDYSEVYYEDEVKESDVYFFWIHEYADGKPHITVDVEEIYNANNACRCVFGKQDKDNKKRYYYLKYVDTTEYPYYKMHFVYERGSEYKELVLDSDGKAEYITDKIPAFNLVEMGLPIIPTDSASSVNVSVDTSELFEALSKGSVKFKFNVDFAGATVPMEVIANGLYNSAYNNYQVNAVVCQTPLVFVARLQVSSTGINAMVLEAGNDGASSWNDLEDKPFYDARYDSTTEPVTVRGTNVELGYIKVTDIIGFDFSKIKFMSLSTSTDIEFINEPVIIIKGPDGLMFQDSHGNYWFMYFATQEEADKWYGDDENNPFEKGLYVWCNANTDEVTEVTYSFTYETGELHQLDYKYIKDIYYDNGVITTEIVPETIVNDFYIADEYLGIYTTDNVLNSSLKLGATYDVVLDGVEYLSLECYEFDGAYFIGNKNHAYWTDEFEDDIPFNLVSFDNVIRLSTYASDSSHTISITEYCHDLKQLDMKYLPIMEEIYDTVIEIEGIKHVCSIEDPVYKIILGQCIVTFDGESEIVEFIDIGGGSSSAETSLWHIETWDGGFHFDYLGADENPHSVKIEALVPFVKEEYIPDTIARKSDIGNGSKWKLLNEIDVTEVVDSVLINKDLDGNSISTKHMIIYMYLPKYEYNGETGTGYTTYEINGKQVSPATYSYPSEGWDRGYFLFDIMTIGERAYIRCYKNENMSLSTGQINQKLFHLLFTEKGDYEYIKSFEWKVFNRKVLNGSTFRIYGEVDE